MEYKSVMTTQQFMGMIDERNEEVDPLLLDLLLTFTDFQYFKEHMLAFKKRQADALEKGNTTHLFKSL